MNDGPRQLSHYLLEPAALPGPGTVTTPSSFWLALRDARLATGRDPSTGAPLANKMPPSIWLGAIGYLILFDQIGSALRRPSLGQLGGPPVVRALAAFSGLPTEDSRAVYALRCALAHDYSLVNRGPAGNHLFRLEWSPSLPLVTLAAPPWDGDYASADKAGDTVINLKELGQLGEDVAARVLQAQREGDLELAVPPIEAGRRYFVNIS